MRKPKSVREPIQVYLDDAERAFLDEMAAREGVSRSEVLRRSVRQYRAVRSAESPMLRLLDEALAEPGLTTGEGDVAQRHDDYLADEYASPGLSKPRRRSTK